MGALKDIRSELAVNIALEPQTINTDTITVGEVIDTADYDGGVMFVQSHTWTSGTFTPDIQESDDVTFATGVTQVDDVNLIGDSESGQEAQAALTSAQVISSVGVVNNLKRYLRYRGITTLGANMVASAVALKRSEVSKISN